MATFKRLIVVAVGLALSTSGAWLRLSARELAWPNSFSYSGPRESTQWAITELAYQDVGRIVLVFGLVVLLIALVHWLWAPPSDVEGKGAALDA